MGERAKHPEGKWGPPLTSMGIKRIAPHWPTLAGHFGTRGETTLNELRRQEGEHHRAMPGIGSKRVSEGGKEGERERRHETRQRRGRARLENEEALELRLCARFES